MNTRQTFEKQSVSPIYQQAADYLRIKISNKELLPLSKLPAERSLAVELGINRRTLSKALEILCYEGLLVRQIGKGTFINKTRNNVSVQKRNIGLIFSWGPESGLPDDYYNYSIFQSLTTNLPNYCTTPLRLLSPLQYIVLRMGFFLPYPYQLVMLM